MRAAVAPAFLACAVVVLAGCLEASPAAESVGLQGGVVAALPDGAVTVTWVSVGQGDAIVIRFPDAVAVVDAANRFHESFDPLIAHLAAAGITTVDAFFITHPDADHAGGCRAVFDAVDVRAFYHPGIAKDTATWERCLEGAALEGADVWTDEHLDPGDPLAISAHASVRLLHVDQSRTRDPNEGGLVLRLDHGGASLLLAGDIACGTEDAILARGFDVDVDALHVGHHGSAGSTCDPWLRATSPAIGIVSVGENAYGHPTPDALARLDAHGVAVYRTDVSGSVTLLSDGVAWRVAGFGGDVAAVPGGDPEPARTGDPAASGTGTTGSAGNMDALVVNASVDDAFPCQNADVTVTVHVTDAAGAPVGNASVTTEWSYRSTTSEEAAVTGPDGTAMLVRGIGRASVDHEVRVVVSAVSESGAGSGRTAFTPRAC